MQLKRNYTQSQTCCSNPEVDQAAVARVVRHDVLVQRMIAHRYTEHTKVDQLMSSTNTTQSRAERTVQEEAGDVEREAPQTEHQLFVRAACQPQCETA